LLTHPDTVKHAPVEIRDIIQNDFEYHSISGVKEFADGCFFLGEIPLMVPWEKGLHEGEHLKDDSALAFISKNGAIVLTGCSHSGISNICEYAKKVTGQSLHAVVGAFIFLKMMLNLSTELFSTSKVKNRGSFVLYIASIFLPLCDFITC